MSARGRNRSRRRRRPRRRGRTPWILALGGVLGCVAGGVTGCAMRPRASGPPTDVDLARDVALLGVETEGEGSDPDGADERLLALLSEIQARHLEALTTASPEVSAYYIGYDLTDRRSLWMEASGGSIIARNRDQRRLVDVDVRVHVHVCVQVWP